MQKHPTLKQIPVKFPIGKGQCEVIVQYNEREPENYTVVFASHNGKDVTDFYRDCELEKECLYSSQICEGIHREECGRHLENYMPLRQDPFKGNGSSYQQRA